MSTQHLQESALLQALLNIEESKLRSERLASGWSEASPHFFSLLRWEVDRKRLLEEDALLLCEDLIEAAGGLDLRDEWGERQKIIIWYAAGFAMHRTMFKVLFEKSELPLAYHVLQDWAQAAFDLAQIRNKPKLGLAILNVLLSVSRRAIAAGSLESWAEMLRYQILTAGAGVILPHRLGEYRVNAERLLREADALYAPASRYDLEDYARLTLELSAQTRIFLSADLKLLDGVPDAAIRLYKEALLQGEAIVDQLQSKPHLTPPGRRPGLCVPNTLWRLAKAEIRVWRLDDAFEHTMQAIDRYKKLGDADEDLAGQYELLARIEFLRANFDQADAVLEHISKLRAKSKAQ